MNNAPDRIWAASATENYGEWQTTTDGLPRPTAYIRADLYTALEAQLAARTGGVNVEPLLIECLDILNSLIDNIKRHGNYSPESTCAYIDQAGSCIREALSALSPAPEAVTSIPPTEQNDVNHIHAAAPEAQQEPEKIDLPVLDAWFPDGVPVVAVKIMFPEKSQPLTTAEVRHVLAALASTTRPAEQAVTEAAQFLVDRLTEFELMEDDAQEMCRQFIGHIEPALGRLRATLKAAMEAGRHE